MAKNYNEYGNHFRVHCKKEWDGCVQVRDYIIENATIKDEGVVITSSNRTGEKILYPEDFVSKLEDSSKPMRSKINPNESYRLMMYDWDNLRDFKP